MDETIILLKISSLERCLRRIQEKIPADPTILASDLDRQDIISLNLERAIQVCVDIASHIVAELDLAAPMTMAESFSVLHQAGILSESVARRMQKSVGFRNIAVHEYSAINWEVVFAIITEHLEDFRRYAAEIFKWMKKGSNNSFPA